MNDPPSTTNLILCRVEPAPAAAGMLPLVSAELPTAMCPLCDPTGLHASAPSSASAAPSGRGDLTTPHPTKCGACCPRPALDAPVKPIALAFSLVRVLISLYRCSWSLLMLRDAGLLAQLCAAAPRSMRSFASCRTTAASSSVREPFSPGSTRSSRVSSSSSRSPSPSSAGSPLAAAGSPAVLGLHRPREPPASRMRLGSTRTCRPVVLSATRTVRLPPPTFASLLCPPAAASGPCFPSSAPALADPGALLSVRPLLRGALGRPITAASMPVTLGLRKRTPLPALSLLARMPTVVEGRWATLAL